MSVPRMRSKHSSGDVGGSSSGCMTGSLRDASSVAWVVGGTAAGGCTRSGASLTIAGGAVYAGALSLPEK